MCQQRYNESSHGSCDCCCSAFLSPEEEIGILEAIKTMKKIQIDAMDRRIEDLRKAVNT